MQAKKSKRLYYITAEFENNSAEDEEMVMSEECLLIAPSLTPERLFLIDKRRRNRDARSREMDLAIRIFS